MTISFHKDAQIIILQGNYLKLLCTKKKRKKEILTHEKSK